MNYQVDMPPTTRSPASPGMSSTSVNSQMATIPITNSANSSPLFDDAELANILASIPESALMTTHGDQTDVGIGRFSMKTRRYVGKC